MGAAATWSEAQHPRGTGGKFAKGRTVQRKRLGGGDRHALARFGLQREARESRLKAAATANHNRKVSTKIVRKGLTATPVAAAFKKARRIMGTQHRRSDRRDVIPEPDRDTWVRLHWSRIRSWPK